MAGLILTVAQQKGGSGKTTLAANLAIAVVRAAGPVALLDIDPQGSLGEWFEKREASLGDRATGITFRTASGWGARREARQLARDHALVLIDTPPKSDLDSRPAIEAAHRLLVPVQPSPVDVWATSAVLEMAAREKTPVLMILNRVPPRAALTEEVALALGTLPAEVARTRIGNRIAFAAAMGRGLAAIELESSGKAGAEIAALAEEVLAAAVPA